MWKWDRRWLWAPDRGTQLYVYNEIKKKIWQSKLRSRGRLGRSVQKGFQRKGFRVCKYTSFSVARIAVHLQESRLVANRNATRCYCVLIHLTTLSELNKLYHDERDDDYYELGDAWLKAVIECHWRNEGKSHDPQWWASGLIEIWNLLNTKQKC
jgi:hypothetical protein